MTDHAWTDEAVAQLRALWALGRSMAAIGRTMALSKNTVAGKAHRLGLPARPSPIAPSAWNDATRAELRRLWGLGLSQDRIGRQMGLSDATISRERKALGLPARGLPGRSVRPRVVSAAGHGGSPDVARAVRIAHATQRPARALEGLAVAAPPADDDAPPPRPATTRPAHLCKYPLWGDLERPAYGAHRFCDDLREDDRRSYCAAHNARAHVRAVAA